eukprot:70933-Prymnesium_polylepis.2
MAAAVGRASVVDGSGGMPTTRREGDTCGIRAVRVVYGQLTRRVDAVQGALAEVPAWMAEEVFAVWAASEAGWVARARRGFDELNGAAQRHEWEHLA